MDGAGIAVIVGTLTDERDRLRERVEALEAGLRPFADYGRHLKALWWPVGFETVLMEVTDAPNITVADMRRAAELLAPPAETPAND